MIFRIETGAKADVIDAPGNRVAKRIRDFLQVPVERCAIIHVYSVDGITEDQARQIIEYGIWHDPVSQRIALGMLPCHEPLPEWLCEIGFRPGVTDNEGKAARDALSVALDIPKNGIEVYSALQYRLAGFPGQSLNKMEVERICKDLLCNELIQNFRIKSFEDWLDSDGFKPVTGKVFAQSRQTAEYIDFANLDDKGLEHLSRSNTWALNLQEMKAIRRYFENPLVVAARDAAHLEKKPTDVELECLAQTWSEHCKHKIFSSKIKFLDVSAKRRWIIDNLYKTCIRDATAILRRRKGDSDYCRSVFKDNAGVISFINGYDICIKVETHNSPSALDPYGGALTGIVGVNRDPMGTGMGADLVCNIDVFCFAPPDFKDSLPPRILHPARIMEGVRQGIEDGGNQSGVPTVNGSICFDNRYLGKPLVFCGTVGLLPTMVCGHPGYEKAALPGDIIVMAGGRIGKDGIHGATFSSEELHAGSPVTAVQIGDPITQRKLYDFMLLARDKCLYHSITDNGAGGLSSSVGEMAEDTGGCILDLSCAPLKYAGLAPWEILVSEAQERMTFAVPPDKLNEFLDLAKAMDVETTALGEFNQSGYFEIRMGDKTVGKLGMNFLHHGAPQLQLEAAWKKPGFSKIETARMANNDLEWQAEFLNRMLARFNICSKESFIRQYDHEVRGGSVIKPLSGIKADGPTDGAVLRPLVQADAAIVVAHGICPKYSDFDTYWMMANAMDEAIRNAVAVGADPDRLAGVDNFCWCDPLPGPTNPNAQFKLAQLVRACNALRQFSLAFGLPCISGKDSMKNDYLNGEERISIPPTVLFTVLGTLDNALYAQSSDFKQPGDQIYLLGGTWPELGGSEAAMELGLKGGHIPTVDAASALARYRALNGLMGQRSISACHDCSDGGLAVALAEMCIGGRLGCQISLDAIRAMRPMNAFELLYSESASRHIATVRPEFASLLDALGMWQLCVRIGEVTEQPHMEISSGDSLILRADVEAMASAFKGTFSK